MQAENNFRKKEKTMLSHKDVLVQELVRQERLRESEHERLVKLVSQQNRSNRGSLLDQLRKRTSQLRRREVNRSPVH